MNDKYYAKTLSDGRIAVYDKETNKQLTTCNNEKFMVAWMCIEEDYSRKLKIIQRIMICTEGLIVDDKEMKDSNGEREFRAWINRLRFMERIDYYKAIDTMYNTAMNIAKTYYIKDFEREGNFYASNLG